MKRRKGCRMSCDVGEAKEGLENELWRGKAKKWLKTELWRRWSDGKVGEWARKLSHSSFSKRSVAAHAPTFPSLHLRHSSFSNASVALPTPQLIPQSFFRFSYVTSSLLNSPGEPPMPVSNFNKWLLQTVTRLCRKTVSCRFSYIHYRGFWVYGVPKEM